MKLLDKSPQKNLMEAINQLVSRHTYDDFLRKLGGEAKYKAQILEGGYGYKEMVNNLRYLLKRIGYKEEAVVRRLQKMLFEDYGELYDRVVEMIAKKTRLPEAKVKKILSYLDDSNNFNKTLEEYFGRKN